MKLVALLLCLCISTSVAVAAASSYYFGHDGVPYGGRNDDGDEMKDPEDYYE